VDAEVRRHARSVTPFRRALVAVGAVVYAFAGGVMGRRERRRGFAQAHANVLLLLLSVGAALIIMAARAISSFRSSCAQPPSAALPGTCLLRRR
jgi:hypothetical protein